MLKVRKNRFGETFTKSVNPRKQKHHRKENLRNLLGTTKDFQDALDDYEDEDDDYKIGR